MKFDFCVLIFMANPTQKSTKSRTKIKRFHLRLKKPNLVPCPQCKKLIKPHHICPYCGFFKGKEILPPKEKKQKKMKKEGQARD